jgi:hypothetical protein
MNYINSAFKALFKFQPVEISFEHEKTSYFSLTFANANQFGNNAYISPLSNLQDALFEVVKINILNLFSGIIHLQFCKLFNKRIKGELIKRKPWIMYKPRLT